MNRRAAGAAFCAIAAFLLAVRYLCAAIYGSGMTMWDHQAFRSLLGDVGAPLLVFSILSLVVGIFYLISASVRKE